MSDALQAAYLARARSALELAAGNTEQPGAKVKAFIDIASVMLQAGEQDVTGHLRNHANPLVAKAAAATLGDEVWSTGDVAALAEAYVASISEASILDQIKKFCRVIPVNLPHVLIATDAVGNVATEGAPKPVKSLDLAADDIGFTKAAGIFVASDELLRATGAAGRKLFESELAATVTRATNLSVLCQLTTSSTIEVTGTGDPLSDLRAGLRAAGPSLGYVAAMPSGDAADLATRVENRGGMSIRGGSFVPGIEIVAVDGLSGTHVIPASRLALWDVGLELRSARHASVDMRDTPESPAQLVSLWQTSCLGLLIERNWRLAVGTEIVIVGGGS